MQSTPTAQISTKTPQPRSAQLQRRYIGSSYPSAGLAPFSHVSSLTYIFSPRNDLRLLYQPCAWAVFLVCLHWMKPYFKKHIALPQDHGSWVFILSPLLVGIFAGGDFTYATFNLIVAAMSAFMIRQPLTVAVKAYSGRRSKTDLDSASFWVLVYGSISALALLGLMLEGFGYILFLAVPGVPVFAWHLWLVSRRAERRQAGIEVIATGVLSLTAPAAYWIGIREYDSFGWWLWAFTWLQSAASIVYAYLR